MAYFVRTPLWLQWMYPGRVWKKTTTEKILYLSFDDGPHPAATSFVLDQLEAYDARASFFCIGRNAEQYPALMDKLTAAGHSIGNHTYQHLNGWKTDDSVYIEDVRKAAPTTGTRLFRPPYGRITGKQVKSLRSIYPDMQFVMWTLLSGDFDQGLGPADCLQKLLKNIRPGSIVVFHDSEKAFSCVSYVLPRLLKIMKEKGYRFEKL